MKRLLWILVLSGSLRAVQVTMPGADVEADVPIAEALEAGLNPKEVFDKAELGIWGTSITAFMEDDENSKPLILVEVHETTKDSKGETVNHYYYFDKEMLDGWLEKQSTNPLTKKAIVQGNMKHYALASMESPLVPVVVEEVLPVITRSQSVTQEAEDRWRFNEGLLAQHTDEELARITEFSLANNGLRTIPAVLGRMPNLRSLDLSFNSIESLEGLPELDQLELLNLENNNLQSLAGMPSSPNLKELKIGGNDLPMRTRVWSSIKYPWGTNIGNTWDRYRPWSR